LVSYSELEGKYDRQILELGGKREKVAIGRRAAKAWVQGGGGGLRRHC